jgi:hypothetical protein
MKLIPEISDPNLMWDLHEVYYTLGGYVFDEVSTNAKYSTTDVERVMDSLFKEEEIKDFPICRHSENAFGEMLLLCRTIAKGSCPLCCR